MEYPIYTPDIGKYKHSIAKALEDGWISSQGEFLAKAGEAFCKAVGSRHVVLVNNGTSATHLLFKALRQKGVRKVYVPDHVFVAVWNAALYEYSKDDIEVLKTDPATLNSRVDLSKLETGAGLVVVHNVGNVVDVPAIQHLRPDLVIVEDCCEALFETYPNGATTGTAGLCAAVSFFANKLITTGEGGALYTNDAELYTFLHKSCHHGTTSQRYVYDVLGYNYRMTNLQAALLYDQLCDLETILARKQAVYDTYKRIFGSATATTGRWMFVARFAPPFDPVDLASRGIDTRPMFYPIETHTHLQGIRGGPSTDIRHSELIMLPSSPSLRAFDQVTIANRMWQSRHGIRLSIREATEDTIAEFCACPLPRTFRYFDHHTPADCLIHHAMTILAYVDDRPVGYGHIACDGMIGLCVYPAHQRRQIGRTLLQWMCTYARAIGMERLTLTVDVENTGAINLYTQFGFAIQSRTETSLLMANDPASCLDWGSA